MQGLVKWAGGVRLEPHRTFSKKWLLALLPLLLLLLLPLTCNSRKPGQVDAASLPKDDLFGLPVYSESFLILMDKSGSMQPFFEDVRKEAKRLLDSNRKKGKCFADVIVYDARAASALGKIEELTDANAGKLGGYLDVMQAGGGTNLRAAIDLAVKEINDHGRQTTVLILTDGEDSSIPGIISDKDDLLKKAGKGGMVMHTTTPRLFHKGANADAINNYEQGLQKLSRAYQGQFGPNPDADVRPWAAQDRRGHPPEIPSVRANAGADAVVPEPAGEFRTVASRVEGRPWRGPLAAPAAPTAANFYLCVCRLHGERQNLHPRRNVSGPAKAGLAGHRSQRYHLAVLIIRLGAAGFAQAERGHRPFLGEGPDPSAHKPGRSGK